MLLQDRRARTNRFLDALPSASRRRLLDVAEPADLALKQVLFARGDAFAHVYFPVTCVVAMMFHADGGRLEVATVGREGFMGVGPALGIDESELEAVVQSPGMALRVPIAQFRSLLRDDRQLRKQVDRFIWLMLTTVARNAVCNRFHLVEQRMARWLLSHADRTQSRIFDVTHAFMAELLGVRRVGVTTAANELQQRGLITYSRGTVAIRDRDGLRRAACACYRDEVDAYKRHLD